MSLCGYADKRIHNDDNSTCSKLDSTIKSNNYMKEKTKYMITTDDEKISGRRASGTSKTKLSNREETKRRNVENCEEISIRISGLECSVDLVQRTMQIELNNIQTEIKNLKQEQIKYF